MVVWVNRKPCRKRIVVLGGGFGGVYAAIHLERLLARKGVAKICLVSRDNFFLFTPMLHEIAASDLEVTNIVSPLRKLLQKTDVVVGDVSQLDLPNKRF
jgi:NADH dehydrogenase